MKDSGVLWLGDVPEHWDVLPNRTLFAEVKERNHPEDQMLSVTITKGVIPQQKLLEDSSKKDSSNQDKSAYKVVLPGDIAYNKMRAWQGAIGVSDYQGIVSPAYVVQRPRDGVYPRYFHYLLRTTAFAKEAERWSYGITSDMWSLRPEHFKMIYGCRPPLKEQIAITRYLDYMDRRIQKYIRSKQKLIRLLEEQKQFIIHQYVTGKIDPSIGKSYPSYKPSGVDWLGDIPEHWEVRRLKHAGSVRLSGVDKHEVEGERPVLLCNYTDVYNNDTITIDIQFMHATATDAEIANLAIQRDDVLLTKDSEMWNDIGVPALVVQDIKGVLCGYHLALIRPDPTRLIGEFLFRSLCTPTLAYQFHLAANGVTRYGVSKDAIGSTLVPIPPLSEQKSICCYITEQIQPMISLIDRARSEIDLIREYRTRLIADVVTGKLDVLEVAANLPEEAEEMEAFDEIDANENGEEMVGQGQVASNMEEAEA